MAQSLYVVLHRRDLASVATTKLLDSTSSGAALLSELNDFGSS
jgi:hypothetical protein